MRLGQHRVDRTSPTGRFCGPQRNLSNRHVRHQQRDSVFPSNTKTMKHVGGLPHLFDQLGVGKNLVKVRIIDPPQKT